MEKKMNCLQLEIIQIRALRMMENEIIGKFCDSIFSKKTSISDEEAFAAWGYVKNRAMQVLKIELEDILDPNEIKNTIHMLLAKEFPSRG